MVEADYTGVLLDGRYRVRARLGQGGMGTVYVAEHVGLAQPRAIKFLRADIARKPGAVQRFLQEARVLSAMRHDNLVGVIDMGEHAGSAYYVMELLAGEDLRRRLRRLGGLGWPQTRAIALQMCAALRLTHARGVVHRDLKPENCFCVDAGDDGVHIKLLDFGVAKVPREAGGASQLTGAGELLGTIGYMAPEQLEGQGDRRADIYSLGAVMFEMLAGRPLHTGNAYEILARMLLAPAPALASVCAVDPAIDRLLATAVARDPEQRFASMDAFAAAIAEIPVTAEPQVFDRPASARAEGETTAGGTPVPGDMPVTAAHVPEDMRLSSPRLPEQAPGVHVPQDSPSGAPALADTLPGPRDPTDGASADPASAAARAPGLPVPPDSSPATDLPASAGTRTPGRPVPADSSPATDAPASAATRAPGLPGPTGSPPGIPAHVREDRSLGSSEPVPTGSSSAPHASIPPDSSPEAHASDAPVPADSSPAPPRSRAARGLVAALLVAGIAWQVWPADEVSTAPAPATSPPATAATGPAPAASHPAGAHVPGTSPDTGEPVSAASHDTLTEPPVPSATPDTASAPPVPAASPVPPVPAPAASRPTPAKPPRDATRPATSVRPLTREALRGRLARELASCGSPYVAEEIAVRVTPGKDGELAGLAALADDRLAPGTVDCLERELARVLAAFAEGVDAARAFDVSLTLPRRGGG